MATRLPDDPSFGQESSKRSVLLIVGFSTLGFFFFINDILGLIEGGGVFSLVSATSSIRNAAPSIDVDENALRTLFMAALAVPIISVCIRLNVSIERRLPSVLFFVAIIGGAFTADEVWGERIITAYMAHHGYSRCVSDDFERGSGKSRVWFRNYVHSPNGCWVDRLAELYKQLPKRTGALTRLDHITLTNIYLTYSYMLTDPTGRPLEQQAADRVARNSSYLSHGLRADVCANRYRNALSRGLIENFGYSGSSGIVLMVSVSPASCAKAL